MVKLRRFNNTTLSRIKNKVQLQELRPYLGMSKIGHPCARNLWYSFRWAAQKEIPSRMRRLFKRGRREELAIIQELESVGVICYGYQSEIEMAFGHSKGHIDGKAIRIIEAPKTEHLLEFKTMNEKYFNQIKKEGVKKSKPIYYAQSQIYMAKEGLTRTLFIAVNKNTDEYYFERLRLDKPFAKELEAKAEHIITSEEPPKKLSNTPTWFECKWCDYLEICHYNQPYLKTCRTCISCDIELAGKWKCRMRDLVLVTAQQKIGCERYESI